MINELICFFRGHKPEHISNWYDIGEFRTATNGRGLWQCTRCKKIHMDATAEFFNKRKKKYPTF